MSDSLRFRQLTVRRMPGFEDRGFRLDGLKSGINLVYGPNASGKTTAARALQRLLWPAAGDGAILSGRFTLGSGEWGVDVDGSRVVWTRDGEPSSPPALPAMASRDRYLLSLKELLRSDDRDLVDRIRVESAGGYDVPAAASSLDFGAGGYPRSLVTRLKEAQAALDDASDRAAELRDERDRLADLEARGKACARLAARAEPLEAARDRTRAAVVAAAAAKDLAAYPEAAGRLHGNEVEQWEEWAAREQEVRTALAAAEQAAWQAEIGKRDAGLDDVLPQATLIELDERLQQLRTAESDIAARARDRDEARARRERAGRALGMDPSASLRDVQIPELSRLDAFLEQAQRLRAERSTYESWLEQLGGAEASGAAEQTAADERLDASIRALQGWLQAGGTGTERRWSRLLLGSVVVLFLLAALLGVMGLTWPAAWIAAGVAAAAAAVLLVLRPPSADPRVPFQAEAARQGPVPDAWTEDAVRDRLDALLRRQAERQVEGQRQAERERWQTKQASLRQDEAKLEQTRSELEQALGLDLHLDDLALALVGRRLGELDDARGRETAAAEALKAAESSREQALAAARATVAPYGFEPEDAAAVSACLQDLRERRERHNAAMSALDQAERERARAGEELASLRQKREAVLSSVGAADEQTLRRLAEQREDRIDAEKAWEMARRDLDAAESALWDAAARMVERTGQGDIASVVAELRSLGLDEIARRLDEAEAADEEGAGIRDEVAGIRRTLENARRGHDVEDALAAVDAARAALAERREQDVDDAIGEALARWLEESPSDDNRPRVFHRARELLATITRGQFRLDLSREGDVFRAYDTVARRGRALDELSDGTRIQLLAAVRVAFVETQEQGAAPPLLLDELLANADDVRARAIIDAAITLARAGRQVFYFTAQADELEKWREALLAVEDVEWDEFGLAEADGDGDGPAFDWSGRNIRRRTVPDPDGRDHDAYGGLLHVPPFDPWIEGAEALHLWYLVDDVQALHDLLALGVDRYGKLRELARLAPDALPVSPAVVQQADRTAGLCRRFGELWRHGRPRPVDRSALEASGAISDVFLDRVADLCDDLDGDAEALCTALERGDLPRFRTGSAEELRDWCLQHGHIRHDEPLDDDAIRLRLVAELDSSGVDMPTANETVTGLIRRLRDGAPS